MIFQGRLFLLFIHLLKSFLKFFLKGPFCTPLLPSPTYPFVKSSVNEVDPDHSLVDGVHRVHDDDDGEDEDEKCDSSKNHTFHLKFYTFTFHLFHLKFYTFTFHLFHLKLFTFTFVFLTFTFHLQFKQQLYTFTFQHLHFIHFIRFHSLTFNSLTFHTLTFHTLTFHIFTFHTFTFQRFTFHTNISYIYISFTYISHITHFMHLDFTCYFRSANFKDTLIIVLLM